ncbi:MAG: hypothetical protein N3A69_01795 [Leptospiraceae bacterium]|nr:hypothetical protein [Leptospiraceae bacterium]
MNLIDYFRVSLKSPSLEGIEKENYERRSKLKKNFEKIYSRLETIELCNGNSKYEDSLVLANYLVLNIANALGDFFEISRISTHSELSNFQEKLPSEIQKEFQTLLKLDLQSSEEDNVMRIEEDLGKAINKLEKILNKNYKQKLENPLDKHYTRLKVQGAVLTLLIAFGLYKGAVYYLNNRPLKPTVTTFELSSSPNRQVHEGVENYTFFSRDYTPSDKWQPLSFELEKEIPLRIARLIPIRSSGVRFQIRNLKVTNSKGEVTYEDSLKVTDKLIQEAGKRFFLDGVKPGRFKVGYYSELETLNENPNLYFLWEKPVGAKKIEFEIRMVRVAKKFND